jgi:hypothetical protein
MRLFKLMGQGEQRGFRATPGAKLDSKGQSISVPMQGHRHSGRATNVMQGRVSNVIAERFIKLFEREGRLIAHTGFEYRLSQHWR